MKKNKTTTATTPDRIPRPGAAPSAALAPPHSTRIDTIADYVAAAVTPYVSAQLISPRALADIQQIAALLPGAITDFFGFECALGTDQPTADFLVCCRVRQGSREILAGQKPGCDLTSFFQEHPVWRRIQAFSKEWARPESPLYRNVHNLWFEFDIAGVPGAVPVPNIFIGSDQLPSLPPASEQTAMPGECAWLTDLALPSLLGERMTPTVRGCVARCLSLLPPGARVFQVGLMLARASQAIRLCVRGISTQEIVEYLGALHWNGRLSELQSLLESLSQNVERIDLDFDIASQPLPKIGLECYLGEAWPQSSQFFAQLVSSKLCTAPKAEALGLWPGIACENLTPGGWPEGLSAVARLMAGRYQSAFVRKLHHVKVVHEAGAPLQAKAYLGVHHKWLAPDRNDDSLNEADRC